MKSKLLLFTIILLCAFLRLYKLGSLPAGLYLDEASIGYNAWSVLHTGRDEHQILYPLVFQAYGEYKLPVYIYGSIPIIKFLGLTPFSVRLLSALSGIAATAGIYWLAKSLFIASTPRRRETVALVSAILFAVSPWSIQFSRGGFEANLALTFLIFGTDAFLRYCKNSPTRLHLLLISFTCYVLALYTYNAARVFLPLFIPFLVFLYSKNLFQIKNKLVPFLSVIIVFSIVIFSLLSSVFAAESSRAKAVFELENKQYQLGPVLGVLQKYFTHFSGEFLFFSGDLLSRHSVRELGELYLPQLPFLCLGLYLLLDKKTKESLTILFWLLISPLPASLATPVPHALRSLFMLAPLTIISALGISALYEKIPNAITIRYQPILKYSTLLLVTTFFLYSVFTYLHVYYWHYVYKTSWDWDENITLLGNSLASDYPNAQRVLIDADPKSLIYIKFFNASREHNIIDSRYQFYIESSQMSPQQGDIIALNGWKGTPSQLKNVRELKMLNNSIGFKIGEWDEKKEEKEKEGAVENEK